MFFVYRCRLNILKNIGSAKIDIISKNINNFYRFFIHMKSFTLYYKLKGKEIEEHLYLCLWGNK